VSLSTMWSVATIALEKPDTSILCVEAGGSQFLFCVIMPGHYQIPVCRDNLIFNVQLHGAESCRS